MALNIGNIGTILSKSKSSSFLLVMVTIHDTHILHSEENVTCEFTSSSHHGTVQTVCKNLGVVKISDVHAVRVYVTPIVLCALVTGL